MDAQPLQVQAGEFMPEGYVDLNAMHGDEKIMNFDCVM